MTENTRASYPIHYIANARIPCVGPHPKNLILLCCDAFGVLPPVSKLTKEQAMYHFISGYTAKVYSCCHPCVELAMHSVAQLHFQLHCSRHGSCIGLCLLPCSLLSFSMSVAANSGFACAVYTL